MDTLTLPEAWASSSPWVHLRVRVPWVPWRLRRWLPMRLRTATCVTHAPATVCGCGMWSVRWGYFEAIEDEVPHG